MSKKQIAKFDCLAKFLLLGDSGVGKTNILLRYSDQNFKLSHIPTIGIDYKIKIIEKEGKILKMQIWDTAGQERFRTLTQSYYKGGSGIILVYSITDRKSFQGIKKWVQQILMYNDEKLPKILVGNKCDASQQQRLVTIQEGQALATKLNMTFLQSSAKENINIKQIFECLAEKFLMDKKSSILKSTISINNNSSQISISQKPKKKKKQCC